MYLLILIESLLKVIISKDNFLDFLESDDYEWENIKNILIKTVNNDGNCKFILKNKNIETYVDGLKIGFNIPINNNYKDTQTKEIIMVNELVMENLNINFFNNYKMNSNLNNSMCLLNNKFDKLQDDLKHQKKLMNYLLLIIFIYLFIQIFLCFKIIF